MDILYTLIPLSILLVFAILVALAWAAHSGQFEDLDVEAERILLDDFAPPPADAPPATQGAAPASPPASAALPASPSAPAPSSAPAVPSAPSAPPAP